MKNAAAGSDGNTDKFLNEGKKPNVTYAHLTTDDSVYGMANHPAFRGFGEYLLPWDDNTPYYDTSLKNVHLLLPYYNHVDPDIVVGAVNHMIDERNAGKTIFNNFYTAQQKQKDPAKEATGLFFFRGKPGAPFAVVCPGGGFAYVGSLHEGFPLAVELSKRGYNAFVLKYRVGSEVRATEDLAAAISFIFVRAEMFAVSVENHSLWAARPAHGWSAILP